MAQALENSVFAVTWHIENFSMCPLKKGETMKSPEFVVDALEKTTWRLWLDPKGDNSSDGNHMSCYICRSSKKEEPDKVNIDYSITMITTDTKSVKGCTNRPKNAIAKNSGYGFTNFKPIKTLLDYKDEVLPNDVFTLLCCIRQGTQSSEKPSDPVNVSSSLLTNTYLMEEICTVISDGNISKKTRIEHCILNTRIPVERRLITWVIKDFKSQLQSVKKFHVSVLSNLREKSELLLSCYVSSNCVRIDIERKDKNFKQMLMRCKVSVLGRNDVKESKEAEHLFEEGYEVWSFPLVVKLSTIENSKSEILNGDALKLRCEFLISYKGEEVTNGGSSFQNNSIGTDSLRQDIKGLLNQKELTDVTLSSEGFELPVHKSLICARSPVFRKMFSSETEEKQTGVVHITDIDVDTLKNMRNFIYEDRLPDFDVEHVKRLYSAADKYEILSLKKQCAAFLKFNLSASNVCDVLTLADLHQDADLLKHVHCFLRFHSKNVFRSTEWLNLMEINYKLAGETMRELLTKD